MLRQIPSVNFYIAWHQRRRRGLFLLCFFLTALAARVWICTCSLGWLVLCWLPEELHLNVFGIKCFVREPLDSLLTGLQRISVGIGLVYCCVVMPVPYYMLAGFPPSELCASAPSEHYASDASSILSGVGRHCDCLAAPTAQVCLVVVMIARR